MINGNSLNGLLLMLSDIRRISDPLHEPRGLPDVVTMAFGQMTLQTNICVNGG